jgi:hypothetical protein
MPTFTTLGLRPEVPEGAHLGKIIKATERTSSNGNEMIVMTIELPPPGRQRLRCTVTFVPGAQVLVNALCQSAGLIRPSEPDIQVELCSHHLLNRYLYFRAELDESGAPKIVRFLSREQALSINPKLAGIAIQPLLPITLPVVERKLFP